MRFILLLLLTITCQLSAAVPAADLTDDQILQQYREAHPNTAVTIRKEATEWAKLGANVSEAIVSAAKGLGVAASEFASTPLGILLIAFFVFKLVGAKLLACAVAACVTALSVWFYRRTLSELVDTKYENRPVLWGLWQRRFVVSRTAAHDYARSGARDLAVCVLIIGTVIPAIAIAAILANI